MIRCAPGVRRLRNTGHRRTDAEFPCRAKTTLFCLSTIAFRRTVELCKLSF